MTRKDYERFAGLLNSINKGFPDFEAKRFLINNMCEIFETDNPRFDRSRFMDAVYKSD
jgi:hypothetical protein